MLFGGTGFKFRRVDQRQGFRNFDPPVAETLGGVCSVLSKIINKGGTFVCWDAIFASLYFQQKMSNKKMGLDFRMRNGCEHSDISYLVP